MPEFSTYNIPPAMMRPNMNMNRMNINNMGGNMNRNMGMNNMGMNMNRNMGWNMNRNMGPAMNNMNPWGPNTRGMGVYGGPVARGGELIHLVWIPHESCECLSICFMHIFMLFQTGQLVVAGSVVGQWGANWGRGGFNNQQRGGHQHQQRGRGNRVGRKVKEEGGASKENEKIKILTKEQSGKENHGEDEEVDVVVES